MSEIILMAGACIVQNNKTLLLKQSKISRHANLWGPPGGHRDENETLLETAKREVLEETGLNVDIKGIVESGIKFQENGDVHFITLYYATVKGDSEIKLDKENDEYLWVTQFEIEKDKYPLRDPLLKDILIKAIKGEIAPVNSFKLY